MCDYHRDSALGGAWGLVSIVGFGLLAEVTFTSEGS